MNSRKYIICILPFLTIVIFFVTYLNIPAKSHIRQDVSCMGLCHPEETEMFKKSVHRDYDLLCTDCHGGNSDMILDPSLPLETQKAKAHDKSKGFKGKPHRLKIPELCASCHSRPEIMI